MPQFVIRTHIRDEKVPLSGEQGCRDRVNNRAITDITGNQSDEVKPNTGTG